MLLLLKFFLNDGGMGTLVWAEAVYGVVKCDTLLDALCDDGAVGLPYGLH